MDLITILEGAPPPDVGERPEEQERRRRFRPTLVDAGINTGNSRVRYQGHNIPLHLITKDFFITVVQLDTTLLVCIISGIYIFVFLVWSFIWWLIVRYYPGCLYGATTYVEALAFSAITQMTIGYGNTGPQACWAATWLIIVQSIIGVVLEAIVLGVVFARISHPHQRARSIFISNKAVISRRDGILKFMFRVADIRNAQVVEPKVKAYLYTWGAGRLTAEGERIPVRVEPLEVDYIDGMLLLPLIIEHTVDERSPLCGHTHQSLSDMNAEIVVTFEGTTEMGNPFMARRSYIPEEIFWGYQFSNVLATPPSGAEHFTVHLDVFHKIERQKGLPDMHPAQLSQLVVNRAKRTVPYPLLGENTLVLSDSLCVAPNEDGELTLVCRVGDTYPNQMLEITARMYFYKWKDPVELAAKGFDEPMLQEEEAFQQLNLDIGYEDGTDRVYLRLPTLLTHVINADSPLASWREAGGLAADGRSEIVVVLNGYMNVSNSNVLRQRTYSVDHHVRYGYVFTPIVKHPALCRDGKSRVRWHHFHDVKPAEGMEKFPPPPPAPAVRPLPSGGPSMTMGSSGQVLSTAPESHANMRSIASVQGPKADGVGLNALAANLARNDYTVLPMDLQRYACTVGGDASQLSGAGSSTLSAGQGIIGTRIPEALAKYAQDTLEAGDSLPHAAALHPALPGPDRFRQTDMEAYNRRSDYTVLPMDLHRYSMAVGGPSLESPRQAPPSLSFTPLPADFRQAAAAAVAAAKGSGRLRSTDQEHPVAGPPPEETAEMDVPGGGDDDAAGPLSGVHIVSRTASRAGEQAEGGEEEAGPIHFTSTKDRPGGKSYSQIASLFKGGASDEDDEDGTK